MGRMGRATSARNLAQERTRFEERTRRGASFCRNGVTSTSEVIAATDPQRRCQLRTFRAYSLRWHTANFPNCDDASGLCGIKTQRKERLLIM